MGPGAAGEADFLALDRGQCRGADHDHAGRHSARHERRPRLRRQIKKALVHYGIDKEPLGIDIMEIGMLRALEAEGIEVVDGAQALLDAREIKTGTRSSS